MMQTAWATPAGAKSTAAQHTRAEKQQLRPQSHCKQHRSSPNGCSLSSTSMPLRLHHCYYCNIVHTALVTIATATILQVPTSRLPSASATAAATTLLRQHCSRNYNYRCHNHAITAIANTVAIQVQPQVQTSATA